MNQKALKTLEFDKIIHILTAHAASEGAKEMCRKLVPYDNINDVEKYRKKSLYVTRENAVKLKKNEYFIADLIGLSVESDEGEDLGEVSDVLQTGANDVYVLSKEGMDDILLPAIRECVKNVDLEGGKMTVHLLPGLRELNEK